ncbi:ABC transporter substrate-binding protein [Deinococcus detaillensis]|uniref:ABC transporter substrate-binding protein n=1 Tax=Deinococcus detaillensis TaxID=2592048 RepID=A0A553V2G6_9DEIO|nr:ABC transporter substrate-binding protein [Deinococcus detaillensis]TSA86431.1 ABC transporter substrate-binding protein [Deinococcus detaillensis]
MTHRTRKSLAVLILTSLSWSPAPLVLSQTLLSQSALAQSVTPPTASTVRIGFFPNLTHAPALVAYEKGYYDTQIKGVKVETKEFTSGTTLNEAFAAGALDIGFIGPGPVINGAAKGMPVQIIAGSANAGAVLVARKDSGVRTLADLAGKNVAIPALANTQDVLLRNMLSGAGLKSQSDNGDVTIVSVAPADVGSAFLNKQIDAALVPEPWGAVLEAQGHKVIADEKSIWRGGNYPAAVVIVNTKFAQANPEIVKGFLKAHLQAVALLNKSPAAAQVAVSSALLKLANQKIDPRALQRAMQRTKFTADVDTEALKEYGQLNINAGYSRKLPDFDKLVNLTMLYSLMETQSKLPKPGASRTLMGIK